jgi:hypothetical protein
MGSLHTLAGLRLGDAVGVSDGPAARAADDLADARVRAAVRGGPRPERARRRRLRAGPGGWKRKRCAHAVLTGHSQRYSQRYSRGTHYVRRTGRAEARAVRPCGTKGVPTIALARTPKPRLIRRWRARVLSGTRGHSRVYPSGHHPGTLGHFGALWGTTGGTLGYSAVLWGTLGRSGVLYPEYSIRSTLGD